MTISKTYLTHGLLKQIFEASKVHKKLKASKKFAKAFEHSDLVNSVYLKAYKLATQENRHLSDAEVKRLCRNAGYQAYREHLPIFRSHYTLSELEDMGNLVGFPQQREEPELTAQQLQLRRLLGLTDDLMQSEDA